MKIKKWLMGVVGAVLMSLALTPAVLAWGPERPTYTMNNPAHSATFNSITDNAAVGDERDFVRIVEKNTGNEYVSDIELEAGKQYEVYIYFHNDASATFNDKAHNYVGVARETRVSTDFPDELAAGEVGRVIGKISSTTTTPETVWDDAYVRAKQAMTLHYVEGSAKIFNNWPSNGTVLSTRIFSDEGTYIGLASVNDKSELNGVIPGCDQYSGSINYTIQTVASTTPEVPVDPETPVKPTDPEIPSELPKTGPVEIILAVVVVGAIVAGIVYYMKSKKAVKSTRRKVKGKK